MKSFAPADLPVPKLHEHLLGAIAPRPIAFVSTIDKSGAVNLSPFSFFNVFGANPPVLIYSPARSGRTGETKNTHDNVVEVPECVVNIPHYDILYQMNLAAGMYPKGVNEFEKSGLTALPSLKVKPPRVAECFVQMECMVKDVIATGEKGGAGNLVVCEVVMLHIDDRVLSDEGSIDPFKMNYIARLGKQYWCRVREESIISIPGFKMANELGIGFDALPSHIRQSAFLTGNDLARLASQAAVPSADEINALDAWDWWQETTAATMGSFETLERMVFQRARTEIERGSIALAFALLMKLDEHRP